MGLWQLPKWLFDCMHLYPSSASAPSFFIPVINTQFNITSKFNMMWQNQIDLILFMKRKGGWDLHDYWDLEFHYVLWIFENLKEQLKQEDEERQKQNEEQEKEYRRQEQLMKNNSMMTHMLPNTKFD